MSVPRQIRRQAQSVARAIAKSIFAICLALSLWQAPIPWLHCHDSAEFDAPTMAKHLGGYHSHSEGGEFGWHLHFAMIDDVLQGHGCPIPTNGSENDRHTVVVGMPEVVRGHCSSHASLGMSGQFLPLEKHFAAAIRFQDEWRPQHALDDLAATHSLLALLGINRR